MSPKTGLQPLNTATHHYPLKLIILAGPKASATPSSLEGLNIYGS